MVSFSPFPFMFLFVFVFYHVGLTVWMESNKLNWTEYFAVYGVFSCSLRMRKIGQIYCETCMQSAATNQSMQPLYQKLWRHPNNDVSCCSIIQQWVFYVATVVVASLAQPWIVWFYIVFIVFCCVLLHWSRVSGMPFSQCMSISGVMR